MSRAARLAQALAAELWLHPELAEQRLGAVGYPCREDWAKVAPPPLGCAAALSYEQAVSGKQISADPAWVAARAHSHWAACALSVGRWTSKVRPESVPGEQEVGLLPQRLRKARRSLVVPRRSQHKVP